MASLRVAFHPEAVAEGRAAYQWYYERSPSAALAFIAELDIAVERVAKYPLTRPEYVKGTRRYLFRQFPFSLVYRVGEEVLEIIAVAHGRRRPGYWRDRLTV